MIDSLQEPDVQKQQTLKIAQSILSQHFQSTIKLAAEDEMRGSQRSHVFRCRVLHEQNALLPSSVVVKRALAQGDEIYDPNSVEGPAVRLFNEWAGLQFLSERFGENCPIPRFYGGNREHGVLVMEDLGNGQRLDNFLLANDAVAAENALLDLFRVVGRMHAVSIGHSARYNEVREALGPTQNRFSRPDHRTKSQF